MITLDVEQGTPEWFAARCGTPSASNFYKIVTTKGEPSKAALKYLWQLAGERIAGKAEETYQNAAMQRGIEMEAEARNLYEMLHDVKIIQTGICYQDEKKLFSCSPDGLVGKDGLIEIKCPLIYTHVGYLLANELPMDYWQQVQGQLLVTGRKWVDFVSYYPGIKPLIVRVKRDEKFLASLSCELGIFCIELNAVTEKIRQQAILIFENICTKKEYESNGQKKTIWLNVGTLKTLDSGQRFIELNMFPGTSFYVFEKREKNQAGGSDGEQKEVPF